MTRWIVIGSAILWTAILYDHGIVALAGVWAVHSIAWRLHVIEVKLTKLLESRDVYIPQADIDA